MLYGALIFIILVLIIEKFIETNEKEKIETKEIESFKKQECLLTATELKFYTYLKQITNKLGYELFCQVVLYEIIKTTNYKDFNKIKSKSIDFVITNKELKILLCIELDDKTHNQQKRIERDKLLDDIFKKSNQKIVHIKTQNYYNIEELEQQIRDSL